MSSFWGSSKLAAAAEPQPEIVKVPAVNVEETIKDFPADLAATLDAKIEELYTLLSPNTPGLEQFLDKDGLTAKKRVVVKDALNLLHVRAEYTFPYNIVDVFGVLTNSADQLLTDSMKKEQSKLKVISKHSWIEYFAIKGIWPISGRDFVELNNWRLLEDGSVLVVQFSTTSELKPELKDPIRGETIATGFLLTPKPTGTHVVLTIFSDPKGSLPSALVNQGAIAQASGLLESKKLLEKKTGLKEVGAAATYEDLVAAISKNL